MARKKQSDAEKTMEICNKKENPTSNRLPSKGFPIIGIGASAGGLAAFEAFFTAMPADTDSGMAFVLIQHLAPDHKSILAELIRRYARMQVFEAEDGMEVLPNHVYIIPPNRDMAILNGMLQLLEPSAPRGQRLPIDFFFRSLAADQHEHAIGIVLSGTGSDGTWGVRAIKDEGGMVMSQTPESTEYDGMPRSVIATGLADYVLPPAEMPSRLIEYATRAMDNFCRSAAPIVPQTEDALKKIFVLLRARTGQDFSLYKPNTINRRVARRMAVHQVDSMDEYVRYLQQTPAEADFLFKDLLIGVTGFFRDKEAFAALEAKVIPCLFAGKSAGDPVRVWSPGCSTGEEAYSIAMLLHERMEVLKQNFTLQVFATDIDAQAIAQARSGIYPAGIAADVTPERLSRFFAQDAGAYRVRKPIRDSLIFSEQNLVKDPPFSKLDLISCRNLMIYMGPELQKKIIPLFHYALNPGGMLFLGTSETIGEYLELFTPVDRQARLYQRKDDVAGVGRPLFAKYSPLPGQPLAARHDTGDSASGRKASLRELTEQGILQYWNAVGVLVNEHGDILYIHGRAGRYLEPAHGEQSPSNVLKMAREGLQRELTTALRNAVTHNKAATARKGLRVKTNGDYSSVNLTVQPVSRVAETAASTQYFLIVLEEDLPQVLSNQPDRTLESSGESAGDKRLSDIDALKRELRAKEDYLESANEELETSNEELKSANEELQSVNEELQSTNEEMETAKEELQSVNEELSTVNSELQTKVADLTRVNNDMNNLLAGTGVGTVFVDYRAPHPAFHSSGYPGHQPDPVRRGKACGTHCIQPGGLRFAGRRFAGRAGYSRAPRGGSANQGRGVVFASHTSVSHLGKCYRRGSHFLLQYH